MCKLYEMAIYPYPPDNGASKLNMYLIRYHDINMVNRARFSFENPAE